MDERRAFHNSLPGDPDVVHQNENFLLTKRTPNRYCFAVKLVRRMHLTRKNLFARRSLGVCLVLLCLDASGSLRATPANKASFARHYDHFLARGLNHCTTCHLPSANKNPESLDEFPHNPFGKRLKAIGRELSDAGKGRDIAVRLALAAEEDSDGDGIANEMELLLGHSPGDADDKPDEKALAQSSERKRDFAKFLKSDRWDPFQPPVRRAPPQVANPDWPRNAIDHFIAAEHPKRGLAPRPEASKEALLRRIYVDLIGLAPTQSDIERFVTDPSPSAYENMVNQLLEDPRYGERWGRHWMDIWRYSDWAGWTEGNQIRDSQPHIWRWRDWIIESLNADKGYDQMVREMLAADELAPNDTNAVRATGFLARNFKLLSREQWMEDTLKHTGQAFLGLTIGCAKCHDHMTDPISQIDYYRMRAIFEPHQVRVDRVPGQPDTAINGLTRIYDTDTNSPTYLFIRGDEKRAQTNKVLTPAVPAVFRSALAVENVALPDAVAFPDKRDYVVRDLVSAREKAVTAARKAAAEAKEDQKQERDLKLGIAELELQSLLAVLAVEKLEDVGQKDTGAWEAAAKNANVSQRKLALQEARLKLHRAEIAKAKASTQVNEALAAVEQARLVSDTDAAEKLEKKTKAAEKARKDLEEAEKKLAENEKLVLAAEKECQSAPATQYKSRPANKYPSTSTGRRLAFARWLTEPQNPLTARVAVNHIWARHFGRGLVPNVANFGPGGKPPSHPALLDWLAVEFIEHGWSMKHLHRLILLSATYRMTSSPDEKSAAIDPDNIWFWRMNSRTMESEIIRDNVLFTTGNLDATMGGPEIDSKLALSSRRRSIYLRCAQEKQAEFLQIFDGPSVVECYERKPTVMPQQALALANSELAIEQAKLLAETLSKNSKSDAQFIDRAFWRVLSRAPNAQETESSRNYLKSRSDRGQDWARQNFILVLFNHNDFITVR
jgi:hypothetical protein